MSKWGGLFSPSLSLRREPPNTRGAVMAVVGDFALVQFRGALLSCRSLEGASAPLAVGDSVGVIEHPRYSFWCGRRAKSWYGLPLRALAKTGHRAQAAVEYLLRKCPKWSPFDIIEGPDGEPRLIEIAGEPGGAGDDGSGGGGGGGRERFDAMDTDGDGKISPDEWPYGDDTFRMMDADGDGYISLVEWLTWQAERRNPDGEQLYQDTYNDDGLPPDSFTISCNPVFGFAPLVSVVTWEAVGTPVDVYAGGTQIAAASLGASYPYLCGETTFFTAKNPDGEQKACCCVIGSKRYDPDTQWSMIWRWADPAPVSVCLIKITIGESAYVVHFRMIGFVKADPVFLAIPDMAHFLTLDTSAIRDRTWVDNADGVYGSHISETVDGVTYQSLSVFGNGQLDDFYIMDPEHGGSPATNVSWRKAGSSSVWQSVNGPGHGIITA